MASNIFPVTANRVRHESAVSGQKRRWCLWLPLTPPGGECGSARPPCQQKGSTGNAQVLFFPQIGRRLGQAAGG
jgi:hypothetical protein